ncbi:hypothetical protein BCR33DRAFT_718343 [Rhizoclosmatium globosum]|uniref:Uncharacterized protein n=1 Tax=Rhizoclosmatium globosum TaxID=329046 RepID=A0A1Y2ABZ2_9FUNG|nr:hypothetical protein BCR33DRAFT_730614 [Rhizoclosmatium globosum]ORY42650.1 hypothetical protein BCR33DRAFT_718343 [Rhizoclosmatium globosum]|eukprot:ORY20026.1 hypothetical protein BCR33DRAFT_730614 [Rhizoclosmatium globosum]
MDNVILVALAASVFIFTTSVVLNITMIACLLSFHPAWKASFACEAFVVNSKSWESGFTYSP